jgi:hypothetical protein
MKKLNQKKGRLNKNRGYLNKKEWMIERQMIHFLDCMRNIQSFRAMKMNWGIGKPGIIEYID